MRRYSRFNILVLALLTFVSYCTARTIIAINGKCTTNYCGLPVPKSKIYKTTKIIHVTGRYTITRWKTVTKPKYTKTSTGTKNVASTTYKTLSTVTNVHTKLSTVTKTHTATITSPHFVLTLPTLTKTFQSTVTIPAPAGFVGVNDDPDNKDQGKELPTELARRDAYAAPDPAAKLKHVKAIICTKTLLTKTGTSDLWKTTTKSTGTVTKKIWITKTHLIIKTVTKKYAPTIQITVTKTVSATVSTTVTFFEDTTSFLTTVTTRLPQTAYYEACGQRNMAPPFPYNDLWYASPGEVEAAPRGTERTITLLNNAGAHNCCAECQTYAGPGICTGSVWTFLGMWGPPDCPGATSWEECPPGPYDSWCRLTIVDNKPGTCLRQDYEYVYYFERPTYVFNGPKCRKWKYQQQGQPLKRGLLGLGTWGL